MLHQILGNLIAGAASPHHQHCAVRQLPLVGVAVGGELHQVLRQSTGYARDGWRLIGTGRQYHVPRCNRVAVQIDQITTRAIRPNRSHRHATPYRRPDISGVALHRAHNTVAMHELVRRVAVIRKAGQTHKVAGELKPQRVPSFRPPALAYTGAFQQDMLDAVMLQPITHGEACLACADDDCVNMLGRFVRFGHGFPTTSKKGPRVCTQGP